MAAQFHLATRFATRFRGLDRAYGQYVIPSGAQPQAGSNKLHDTKWAWSVSGEVTLSLWEDHLSGRKGLGIVPIRDDSTASWGAIDIDVYPLDLIALVALIKKLELPLIVCRTKSGGAHCYLFLTEPTSAETVRSRLMEWAVALGHPGVEVFPKQTRLASEADAGNWINMPYYAGSRSTRYALRADGQAMGAEEFLDLADRIAISPDGLIAIQLPQDEQFGEIFEGAPPCLQTLARKGFGDWSNNGLFNVAVYLRKRYGDGWEQHLEDYNRRLMVPPVDRVSVNNMVKSVNKKTYTYMCKQEPVCGVCNRQVCLTRDFGVGGLGDDPGVVFGELLKLATDPPVYIWDVDGARLECTVEDIMDQRRFHRLAIAVLNKWPSMIRPGTWQTMVRERLARIVTVEVPEDATRGGQFWEHVENYINSKVKGRTMDELLTGKPFSDPATGRTMFRSTDLFDYLQKRRFNGATEKDVFKWLRARDVQHGATTIKGKFVRYWSITTPSSQTEPFDVPRRAPEEAM